MAKEESIVLLKELLLFPANWPRSLMDRASDYGSEGWGFESLRGHKYRCNHLIICGIFFVAYIFTYIERGSIDISGVIDA